MPDPAHAETPSTILHPVPTTKDLGWAIALFLGTLLSAFILALGCGFLAKHLGYPGQPIEVMAAGLLVGEFSAFVAVIYFGFLRRGWGPREFGFVRPAHSLWHLLWWFPVTTLVAGSGARAVNAIFHLTPPPATEQVNAAGLGPITAVVAFLSAAVLAPLYEELVFRRMLFDWLQMRLPCWASAAIVVVLFALAHVTPAAIGFTLFFGTSLILARLYFRSMWANFLIHALNNTMLTTLVLAGLLA